MNFTQVHLSSNALFLGMLIVVALLSLFTTRRHEFALIGWIVTLFTLGLALLFFVLVPAIGW